MSLTVTIEEVKERFEELVQDAAARHQDIVVAKNGASLARVVPTITQMPAKRSPGSARGQVWMSEDFDDPLPDELLDSFYS
jgi:prevent-host-death family protein